MSSFTTGQPSSLNWDPDGLDPGQASLREKKAARGQLPPTGVCCLAKEVRLSDTLSDTHYKGDCV